MKPNVLFIVIDGFRADKCYGKNKTSKTPHLDSLIKNGVYFSQAISCSDGTRTCLGSIFSGKYPFQSGITTFSSHEKSTVFFNFLKQNGYNLYATVPNVDFWITLTKNFDDVDLFSKPYVYLNGGTGKQIIQRLKNLTEPWIYYMHIMDLHRSEKFALPEEFKNEKFGSTDYDQMVSYIDYWIGKILENINLENTIIVITSDHGDYVPIQSIGHRINYIPKLVKNSRKIKSFLPTILHPFGLQFFLLLRKIISYIRSNKLKKELSPEELRTLSIRGNASFLDLYDDVLRIPLIFSGASINSSKIISQQVSQLDIFPTLFSLLKFNFSDKIQGSSLFPLISNNILDEQPVFIENQLLEPNQTKRFIGVRTQEFKYYRLTNDLNQKFLFDLKNDPKETTNCASVKPDIIKKFEILLEKRNSESVIEEFYEDSEIKKIQDELRKLGYI